MTWASRSVYSNGSPAVRDVTALNCAGGRSYLGGIHDRANPHPAGPWVVCSPRLYADQIPQLWRLGPVIIADHTRDDSVGAIARRILSSAPPRFALVGLSMGGYISFEILRQAPQAGDEVGCSIRHPARTCGSKARRAALRSSWPGTDGCMMSATRHFHASCIPSTAPMTEYAR